jgi:hypothetical protein
LKKKVDDGRINVTYSKKAIEVSKLGLAGNVRELT